MPFLSVNIDVSDIGMAINEEGESLAFILNELGRHVEEADGLSSQWLADFVEELDDNGFGVLVELDHTLKSDRVEP